MKIAEWNDYEIIASGGGEKLERWGDVILLRPDPQAIWRPAFDLKSYKGINAAYNRESTGGGSWTVLKPFPNEWVIGRGGLKFLIKPMGFKHTGLFPEQAVNWDYMRGKIAEARKSGREVRVLNLFAYTGGATVACLSAGAQVTHVDAARGMVERAGENVRLNNLDGGGIRYIVDDCRKFVTREIKRGKSYDAVILDPPSFGRGANNEMWKLEDDIYDFLKLVSGVLSDNALFVLLNSYTTGLQPVVMANLLNSTMPKGRTDSYEVCLKTKEENIIFPCGASAVIEF